MEDSKGVGPEYDAGLDRNIFENRISQLPAVVTGRPLDKKNLFIVTGPTGAGKTTILNQFLKGRLDVSYLNKDFTRELREGEQDTNHRILREEFETRAKRGDYVFYHQVKYLNPAGEETLEFYGAPRAAFNSQISKGDVIMTLGDPDAFKGFFTSPSYEDIRQKANIIPVLITTSVKRYLEDRLEYRRCSKSEREKRLLLIDSQWEAFDDLSVKLQHTILNDNPDNGPENAVRRRRRLPLSVKGATYSNLDLSLRKLSDIITFYQQLKQTKLKSVSDLDVHAEYVDKVLNSYFGTFERGEVVDPLANGSPVPLKTDAAFEHNVKQRTGLDFLVEHVFRDLAATGVSYDDGTLEIKFNSAIRSMTPENKPDALRIVEALMTPPFYGARSEKGIIYSLTDVPPEGYSGEKVCAVHMKVG